MEPKLNRSYARRVGKRLSTYKTNLLDNLLPKYLYSKEKLDQLASGTKIILEIGSGMGDHILNMLMRSPEKYFITAEVYLNGVGNIIDLAQKNNLTNLSIWPSDVDELLPQISGGQLDEIHILFPDPWPKRKQMKKRLVNQYRLQQFSKLLKPHGKLIFASDISEYFMQVHNLVQEDKYFSIDNFDSPVHYAPTKYHKIAMKEDRSVQFLQLIKIIP